MNRQPFLDTYSAQVFFYVYCKVFWHFAIHTFIRRAGAASELLLLSGASKLILSP